VNVIMAITSLCLTGFFGTAYVSYDLPGEYGVDENGFPQQNILKQFTYAFRPSPPPSAVVTKTPQAS
jgi:hypothetical protein